MHVNSAFPVLVRSKEDRVDKLRVLWSASLGCKHALQGVCQCPEGSSGLHPLDASTLCVRSKEDYVDIPLPRRVGVLQSTRICLADSPSGYRRTELNGAFFISTFLQSSLWGTCEARRISFAICHVNGAHVNKAFPVLLAEHG